MKIAIDESGDNGRKFWRGSSKWFIVTAVIVPDSQVCGPTCQSVDSYRKQHSDGAEIHFSQNSHQQHVNFLDYMNDKDYIFASVCINKKKLLKRKPHVFASKMALLQFSFDSLFTELKPWLDSPVVLIDSNGPKHFNKALTRHLMKLFGSPKGHRDVAAIKQIRTVDSRSEPLVQLADYISGSVHHHVDGKHNSDTFEKYVGNKGKIFYI